MSESGRNTHRVKVSYLRPGQKKSVRVGDKRLLLVNDGGTIYAVQEMCTHRRVSLSRGWVKDGTITCADHGACFWLKDGSVERGPTADPLETYPVKVVRGFAEIDLGGPDA